MTRVLVVYSSVFEANADLARLVEAALASAEAEVRVRHVTEVALQKDQQSAATASPLVGADDLDWTEGFVFTSPSHSGLLSASVKAFVDQNHNAVAGRYLNKTFMAMATSAFAHAGQERVVDDLNAVAAAWGCVLVPASTANPTINKLNGNPYGLSFVLQHGKLADPDVAGAQGNAFRKNHGMLYGNVAVTFVVQMAFNFLGQGAFKKEGINGEPNLKWSGIFFLTLLGFSGCAAIGFGADHFIANGASIFVCAIVLLILVFVFISRKSQNVDPTPGAASPDEEHGLEDRQWEPSVWIRALVQVSPTRWPVGRSIRAALGVGGPLLIASLLGNPLGGMWIAMGALLITAGEHSTPYRARFLQVAVTTPIAAAAFFLGALGSAPPAVMIGVMTVTAFAAGIVSGYSGVLSSATMQAMVIAAVSIGVPEAAPYWPAAALFVAGSAIYSALLAVEALMNRHGPERTALVGILRALAGLATDSVEHGADLERGRAAVTAALDSFDKATLSNRRSAQGPSRSTARAAAVSAAADQVFARLLAHDAEPELSRLAAQRLTELGDAVQLRRRPQPTKHPAQAIRVNALEAAIWGGDDAPGTPHQRTRLRTIHLPGNALVGTAALLALCTGLAYLIYAVFPFPHGYWIALTVALVMKPDLGSVFARAVLRTAGTVGGAVVAIGIDAALDGPILMSLAIAVFAALLPWGAGKSYAVQTFFLTPLVMLLIDLVSRKGSILDISLDRVLATAIGGVIVILFGFLLWPSRRRPDVARSFGTALDAVDRYAALVTQPGTSSAGAQAVVADARRQAYRLLSDTDVALQRRLADPPPSGRDAQAWLPAVEAARRLTDRITDVSASTTPRSAADDAFIEDAESTLQSMIAGGPHRGTPPQTLPGTGRGSRKPQWIWRPGSKPPAPSD